MWQIPCKMTNSSSKPLQTLGKWYQPRNPKKIPKPAQKKIPKTISHPFQKSQPPSVHQWSRSAIHDAQQQTSPIGFLFLNLPPPPCATLPVYVGDRYVLSLSDSRDHIKTLLQVLRSCGPPANHQKKCHTWMGCEGLNHGKSGTPRQSYVED